MIVGVIEVVLAIAAIFLSVLTLHQTTGYWSMKEFGKIAVGLCILAAGFILVQWGMSRVDPIGTRYERQYD